MQNFLIHGGFHFAEKCHFQNGKVSSIQFKDLAFHFMHNSATIIVAIF